ncbi:MAG TPA: phosphate ABC transporter ATP-binding protein PstB [Candidatus Limnocylindrales bacterium]|nr:phosphate ABC transporter ATP-binding protein PstB [Candidatus Limnocylindrales bacterium]
MAQAQAAEQPGPVEGASAAAQHPPKLQARHVNFFYGDFQALHDVSLDVRANQITALIGPSGCGKTTFLRIFNRMHDLVPDARVTGEVLFDGQDILASNADVIQLRRRVGMLFQRPNPFPKSIYENVAYGPRMLGWSRSRVDQVVEQSLKDTGLWDEVHNRLRRSALNLSGGQQQRLCLARALAVDPEVLLMDEPCAALDPIATLKIEDLMQQLKHRYTMVIVTHNMQQAARVSDFTAFMLMNQQRAGELIEFDSTDNIFNRPKDSRTEDYITGRFG